jgi:hypothetical protein
MPEGISDLAWEFVLPRAHPDAFRIRAISDQLSAKEPE